MCRQRSLITTLVASFLFWGVVGCGSGSTSKTPANDTGEPVPLQWDERAPEISCALDEEDTPMLDAVLADAGLAVEDVGYSDPDWGYASYRDYLDDLFRLSWFRDAISEPLRLSCRGGQAAMDVDYAALGQHRVSAILGVVMSRLDHTTQALPQDASLAAQSLVDLGALPIALAEALVPVFAAMSEVARVRGDIEEEAPVRAGRLVKYGHGGVILDFEAEPDLTAPDVQAWLVSPSGPRGLYDPARVLAYAIEEADLSRFEGLDVEWEVETELGLVMITGPGSDAPGDIGEVAFLLDMGGDDTWTHPVGSSGRSTPVSVHIDLGGNDVYGYEEADSGDEHLLPADSGGRYNGDANYGRFSLSTTGRQGSGRFGVGMLFDLGGGSDQYKSLRMSQGWGHLGVGVLFDEGGSDSYEAEAGAQGAGSLGIGVLLDVDGNDTYRTYTFSQGFGYVGGGGLAWDGAGDDTWYANPGREQDGGHTVYYSAQMTTGGNSSFVQGAGFGHRNDAELTFLSGGIGMLRDAQGDDSYIAGVFAQGTGYWQGTGMLLDGAGHDEYDAYWYVQGAAAHYAIGMLLDDGDGDDALNSRMVPVAMQFGAGHDFSVGVHVNEAGDDNYTYAGLGAGASNCQGIGIVVDNDGSDVWNALSSSANGLGNHSGECETRTQVDSIGLLMDSGGSPDTWIWPGDSLAPADDSSFGHRAHDTEDEFGGAVDGAGETGIHAGGFAP